ncbi:MAG: DNA polymerase III subunit alpha [bacterium]
MKGSSFVHLHVHSEYSLLDGAIRFSQALEAARAYKMPALAITDHGNLFGAVSFYQEATKAGVKPVIGCELYMASGSRWDRTSAKGMEGNHHLLVLARNSLGYRNLLKLVSKGYLEGFYYKPRIDRELLAMHSEGLVGMSACLHGEIPHWILQGQWERAVQTAQWYRDTFKGNFFLELMHNGIPEQDKVNEGLLRLAKELGLGVVATNDCHYLKREEARSHDVLLCIQTGKTLESSSRLKFQTDQFYFKSPEEMACSFSHVPEALSNTLKIAQECELELELGKYFFPSFPLPEGETLESRLEALARQGFQERMAQIQAHSPQWFQQRVSQYTSRLEHELRVIQEMGFAGYFLIVADFIQYARDEGIPVGPGRGSAAGSLVAYCLRITDIDPIRYNLLFERFLNPERKSMPDIDIDFCKLGRDRVIRYVAQRYGQENVAQITTFGRMEARAVVRDVGRVLGMPYEEVDRLAKLIPKGPGMDLGKAMLKEPKLKELAQSNPQVKDLLEVALSLEGLVRHASTHAAGVVISDRPIVEHLPLYRSQEGELVTQYDMKAVEAIGLVKFDFLGLRTLTMMDDALKLIAKSGTKVDLRSIPLDDPATYHLLSSGDTDGVFQLESSGMRELLVRMKPTVFEDLIALVALYRPGPLGSGMVEEFIERKQGKVAIRYELPQLEPILKDTYGIIVYQEQVMQIAVELAGYTMGQADVLRKAMGKKIARVMEEQRQVFLNGARKNGVPEDVASRIFDLMAKFGEYGFNKSHSAAYAMVAYQTAYLKTHFPVEFMAALLTSEKDRTDKIIRYISSCKERSIEVLPPDVNESDYDFSVSDGKIRFGLGGVKNVGRKAIDAILQARKKGPFKSLRDFCSRVDTQKVNKRVMESLIKCGAFDSFGGHRAQYMAGLDQVMEEAQRLHRARARGQMSMFGEVSNFSLPGDLLPEVEPWEESRRLEHEKESLGFYVTGHPMERITDEVSSWCNANTETLASMADKAEVRMVGVKRSCKEVATKKGERMGFLTLEDLHGSVEVVCFPEAYRQALPLIQKDLPLCVRGVLEHGEDSHKLVASEVLSVENAKALMASPLEVVVPASSIQERDLLNLKELLRSYPGYRAMRIHMVLEGGEVAVLELPETLRVNLEDGFLARLRETMGGRVEILSV